MYYIISLVFAFVVTLLFVSKVAEMLLAKRFSFSWIALASISGVVAAAIAYLLLSIFITDVEPMIMMIVSISVMFLSFCTAFKYINIMSWSGAITTGVANIASILIALTAAVVLNGQSLEKEFARIAKNVSSNTSMITAVATGDDNFEISEGLSEEPVLNENGEVVSESLEEEYVDDNAEPVVKELDLLLPAAIAEIKKKEKKTYKEPKYHLANVNSIHSFVGQPIRILRSNGSVIAGSLKKINGSSAYVAQRLYSGVATVPVSIASIRKLEVYRR